MCGKILNNVSEEQQQCFKSKERERKVWLLIKSKVCRHTPYFGFCWFMHYVIKMRENRRPVLNIEVNWMSISIGAFESLRKNDKFSFFFVQIIYKRKILFLWNLLCGEVASFVTQSYSIFWTSKALRRSTTKHTTICDHNFSCFFGHRRY